MKQYAVELHSHTYHSDGDFSVEELVNESVDYGYDGLILTDHNTSSGYKELKKEASKRSLITLSGIEWTTYYGHMLVHDADCLVDWRTATPDTIDEHIKEVKKANGLVGIAHPFAVGSPICTGCHWSFNLKNWDNVDYIEIWNSTCPDDHFWSQDAYNLWRKLLDEGYKISCSAGRDWHRLEPENSHPALTYLETETELTSSSFRQGLETGSFYITLGPKLIWSIKQGNQIITMGETMNTSEATITVNLLSEMNTHLKKFTPEVDTIKLIYNGKTLVEDSFTEEHFTFSGEFEEEGHIRVELWGSIKNKENELLTITNPIYIKN